MIFNKNNFYVFIFIFFCINIISFFIHFFFIKDHLFQVNLDIKNVKSVVLNFNMNIHNKGMLYYDNLDELKNNKLIKILNDKKFCLTEDNIEIKASYYKFLKGSLPYINLDRSMFNESIDVDSFINDPVDKIYRITFLIDDHQINFGLFSITKFHNNKYLEKIFKKIKEKIFEYNVDHHNNFHQFENYVDVLNQNYSEMKFSIEQQIFLKIFNYYTRAYFTKELNTSHYHHDFKSNNPNLHPHHIHLPKIITSPLRDNFKMNYMDELFYKNYYDLLNTYSFIINSCEKEILNIFNNSFNDKFIARSRVISYENLFHEFSNSINDFNLNVNNKKQIEILSNNKKILIFVINFCLSLLFFFIYRKI